MLNEEPKYCWEFHHCPEEARKDCPAHIYPDEKCWQIASNYCTKFIGGGAVNTVCLNVSGKEGILNCRHSCEWFKKFNPHLFN